MNKLATVLLIFTILTSCVRENAQIITLIKPNKKYTKQLNTLSESEIDIVAEQEILAEMEENGIRLPIMSVVESKMRVDIITEDRNDNGEFFATKEYGEVTTSTTLNGKKRFERKPYSGMKILGRYDKKNQLSIDSIVGVKSTHGMKYFHTYTLENLEMKIISSHKLIKIGDTIKNKMPLSIPIQGTDPVNAIRNIDYILTKIANNKAFFKVNEWVQLDPNWGMQENTEIFGTGTGECEFDINQNQLTRFTSELPMDLTVVMDERKMTVKIKMIIKTDQTINVE